MEVIKPVSVQVGQNIWDIAQQEYGSAEGVILILQANPGLSLSDDLEPGRVLNIWSEKAVQTLSEIISVEPFGSQLHGLLQAWALLIVNNNTTSAQVDDAVIIPTLKLESGLFRDSTSMIPGRVDTLKCWWESDNLRFLEYNPEVWLFKRKSYSRRKLISETLGNEMIVNGFTYASTWVCGENVSIADNAMIFSNAVVGNYGALLSPAFVRHRYYEVSFEVIEMEAGSSVMVSLGNDQGDVISENGVYSKRMQRTNETDEFKFTCVSNGDFKIINVSVKQWIRYFDKQLKKRWAHESHLNGIKYPGSNFYTGETSSEVTELAATGRHTEFPLTAFATRQKMILPLNQYEYFHAYSISKNRRVMLSDETDLSDINDLKCAGEQNLSTAFKIAIVIDNPDTSSPVKKIIGDMSETFYIRTQVMYKGISPYTLDVLMFRYRYNAIISKWI